MRIVPAILGLLLLSIVTGLGAVDITTPVAGAKVYFTPGDQAEAAVVDAIGAARTSVLVQTYSFTSVPIAKALVAAKDRGVDVHVISDRDNETSKYTALDFVAGKGVEVQVDDKVAIAHNKVIIIDRAIVLTGSYNWTRAAQDKNAENLLILPSAELAAAYTANWEARHVKSRPYVRRADR